MSHTGSQREAGGRWGAWHGDPMGGSEEEKEEKDRVEGRGGG